jgi:hypothetical protein
VTIYRIDPDLDVYAKAVASMYTTPEDSNVFKGETDNGEVVIAFVGPKGNAFLGIDNDPAGFIQHSVDFNSYHHSGVDEYEFKEGELKHDATQITLDTTLSFI